MVPKQTKNQGTERHPFLLSIEDVAKELGTSIENGLSSAKVQQLQKEFPPNELEGGGSVAWYKILIKQITNAMILVRYSQFSILWKCADNHRFSFWQWP
jgi:Na+-exporting ATPase